MESLDVIRAAIDLTEVEVRHKDIVYSSRTRAATDQYKAAQKLRIALANLMKELGKNTASGSSVSTSDQILVGV